MADMEERSLLESVKHFALYLSELQSSLDPQSYDLLLRILKGANEALVNRTADINVSLSERDKKLFTPEFGEALSRLLGMLGPLGMHTVVDIDDAFNTESVRDGSTNDVQPPAGLIHLARQEQDRREVEDIARASGMEP